MANPQTTTNRAGALAFIVTQQEHPTTATAYVGTQDENLIPDLEALEQPWMDTLRVIESDDGVITGAALVEWDPEVSIAWIYGPWTTSETWDRDAAALLASVVDQTPVTRHQMYGDIENARMAELAERLGWSANDTDIVFETDRENQARADLQVRPATLEDYPGLSVLHESAFPGTYATARQLLETNSDYTTLVLADADGLIGYVAGQPDGNKAYLDFVAVDPARRRTKAATRLVGALANALPGETITLTCSETQTAAVGLYEALGWQRDTVTRAYDLWKMTGDSPADGGAGDPDLIQL